MAERRRAPRVRLLRPIGAKVRTYSPARVLDISRDGLLLQLDHPLSPGDHHELHIQLDGEDLVVKAVVRRCWLQGSGRDDQGERIRHYRAGIQFDHPQPGLIEHLPEDSVLHVDVELLGHKKE